MSPSPHRITTGAGFLFMYGSGCRGGYFSRMKQCILLVLLAYLTSHTAYAQENVHERHMERAHPTPVVSSEPPLAPVPFVTETPLPTLFLNSSMIQPETDQLPAQNESSIAVNPRNPLNLLGSAVDYRGNSSTWAYYSTDAGRTWSNITLGTARPGWTSSNDPSVCFDHNGKGYLMYGGFRRTGNIQFGENGVFVSSTTDGGKTWGMKHTAVIIHTGAQTADSSFEDKYYIHVDTASTSPNRGWLYTPWKRVVNRDSSTQIVFSKSTDEGATWSSPVAVSERFPGTSEATTFGQSFPLLRTGPDGSIHVVWNSGTESAIRYARSTDGGKTFTTPRIIQNYNPFGIKSTINGQSNSRVKKVVRAECYPSLTIDNTRGSRNGNLYLTWAADNYPNVYFSRSTDNGTTWSPAKIVHSDTTNDQFWSWTALDPTSGEIAVMYSDSRDDAANIDVRTYVSWSADGGNTWIDRRVGDGNNDLRNNPFTGNTFAGDYSGCDFYDGIVYPSWVDMRNTNINKADNDVYTAIVRTRAPQTPLGFRARTIPSVPTTILLSWERVTERAFGQSISASDFRYHLYRDGIHIAMFGAAVTSHIDTALTKYKQYNYALVAVTSDNKDSSATQFASAFAGGSRAPAPPVAISALGIQEPPGITATYTTPRLRLDSVNALVNFSALRISTSEVATRKSYTEQDTGVIKSETLAVPSQGWYSVSAVAIDRDENVSPSSDTLVAFAGSLATSQITFDQDPRFYTLSGPWGRTTNFYRTAPAAFAYAPTAVYQPNRRDTCILYPYRNLAATGQTLRLQLDVAAFIDASDTMFLETANRIQGPWTVRAWWNASKDARWADTNKADDAWRREMIDIKSYAGDTIYSQLRFRSNASRQSDGFYVDNITWDVVSSVDNPTSYASLVVAPNPANSHINISVSNDQDINAVYLTDISGTTVSLPWNQVGSTVIVASSLLDSGFYIVTVHTQDKTLRVPVRVLH